MALKHFQSLEPCRCGAYRYLAAREHKKSYEILLIHQMPGGKRTYKGLANVPKSDLDWHSRYVPGYRPPQQRGEKYYLAVALKETKELERILRVYLGLEDRSRICPLCKKESPESLVTHHTHYIPEESMEICKSCHAKIHLDKSFHPELRPEMSRVTAEEMGVKLRN
jgi:hypothetical protein